MNETWQNPGSQYDYETGASGAENYNHRFNARIDYKINDNQNLMLRPYFRYQKYTGTESSQTDMSELEDDVEEAIQSILGSDGDRSDTMRGSVRCTV